MTPVVGLRVRRVTQHPSIPFGALGTIDIVHENGSDFWVATDEGGFNGWTCFEAWMPVGKEKA